MLTLEKCAVRNIVIEHPVYIIYTLLCCRLTWLIWSLLGIAELWALQDLKLLLVKLKCVQPIAL